MNSGIETISKWDLEKSICEDSFFGFVCRMWSSVIPETFIPNWHIKILCDEMQKLAERVFKRLPRLYDLLINVPPGSTKSTICSVMFPAWIWTRDRTLRSICGSYSYPLSLELSRKSRDVVLCYKYRRMFKEVLLRDDQNTKGYFANKDGGGRFSTSTGGSVTGLHGHFLLIDDPLNPEEAVSDTELKNANNWIARTFSTRKIDKKITPTVLIMQRLHEGDPSAIMIQDSQKKHGIPVRHVCLPSEIDETNWNEVRPRSLRKLYTNGLLDTVRMDADVLNEYKIKLGEYGYAGQFLQRPVPIAGGMFKVERIQIDTPPSSWIRKVRFWDKAGSEGKGAFTVGLLMGEDREHRFWVLDVVRVQMDTGRREALVKQTAELDGPNVLVGVEQEPGSGGKESAENTVRNLRGFAVEVVRPTGDKKIRAMPFSSQVNSHNVYMKEGEWNKDYIDELRFFDKGKYKDQVDASSGAFTVLAFPAGRTGVI
jgi:predicted phage terminase large subunit-like protein